MGLATDYCIKFTVLDAFQLGNFYEGNDAEAIEYMRRAGRGNRILVLRRGSSQNEERS